ncbi:hypothetical protein AVEN_239275-1 [Araneus ventricosus]|uniref:RING-type domain-containing protein n=1 Tax=Araneus ventricosus TaxID=182803 RepID=A0A4Y2RPV5_ARAVE|nr:hypothetical protein AVEN_239275-1 [Araneus ventricosus]
MSNEEVMFLHWTEPFYCGFCQNGKLTKTDTTLACGHKFHLGCLVKRYRIQVKASCPQCTEGKPRFQCSHCGIQILRKRGNRTILSMCLSHTLRQEADECRN